MSIDPITAGAGGAAGTWLWEQFGKDLTGKLLGAAKGRWEAFNWPKAAERYKESLRAQHATIRILGKSDPVPLDGIFTDVYVLDEITARRRYDIEELRKLEGDRFEFGRQPQERHEGLRLIKHAKEDKKNFFILGKPGAGKTTFLRYITLKATDGLLDRIPIFLSLHAWSMAGELTLMPFIVRQFDICNFPDAQLFIENLLASDQAIVLFDGLDEVKLEDDRRRLLTFLLSDFAKKYLHTQVLITCRIAASDYHFDGFRDVEIADFTRDQIHAYARKWFGAETAKHDAFIVDLYEERNRGLRELCASPLLLSMLCLAFDRTGSFPARRAELYEDSIEALLEKWDTSKAIQRDRMYRQMSRQQKIRLLADPAAEAFEAGHYFLEEQWLEKRLANYMRRLPGVDTEDDIDGIAVLKAIEAQHGLLVERASDIYAYAHLSLQEYFAAKYIVDNEARGAVTRLLHSHLSDNRWREVFLLTSSMLSNAEDFVAEIRRAIDRFMDEKVIKLLSLCEMWTTQRVMQDIHSTRLELRAKNISMLLLYSRAHTLNLFLGGSLARNLADTLARSLTQGLALAITLAHDLDRNFAPDRRSHALDTDLKKLLEGLDKEHYNLINKYLYVTNLLVDCLQVSFVSNREEILESLLLPPKQNNGE